MVRAAQSGDQGTGGAEMHEAHAQEDAVKDVTQQDLVTMSQGVLRDSLTSDAVRAFFLVLSMTVCGGYKVQLRCLSAASQHLQPD